MRAVLADPAARGVHGPGDLSDPAAPAEVLTRAAEALGGRVDILVANHALSGRDGTLDTVDAAMLDVHWAVDARSVVLLVQAYARLRAALPPRTPGGRVVMMTSGQDRRRRNAVRGRLRPRQGCPRLRDQTLATALAEPSVTVNTVNPGPVDTDYLTGEAYEAVAACFPAGRWGMPDDPARLIAWLATDEAEWVTGQVVDSEGGFRRP
ncbi:SDR family oxidoreductase [Streptomyces sp. NPDC096153]|uniref:SDR family oxidoreductase n=1 Tax=Streptomyces sp. NPDC096153 TaxID=3155548 RepID=UPI00332FFF84